MNDLRFAFRTLAKSPGFSAVAILMLALGIGASTACFSFLNTFFLRPPPFERPDELVSVHNVDERNPERLARLSVPNFRDLRDQTSAFSGLAFHMSAGIRFGEGPQASYKFGQLVTGNYFEVLGITAAQGRALVSADDAENAAPVAVVSHGFWQTYLGADPAAVGQTLKLNGHTFMLVGVMAPGFRGINLIESPDLWLPISRHPLVFDGGGLDYFNSRRAVVGNAAGRLKPGVTLAQAEAALLPIAKKLAADFPNDNAGRSVRVIPISQAMTDPNARVDALRAGNLLMGLSGLILLIACANLANLLLARAGGRQREIAVRVALGAGRPQIVRQLLVENLLLASLGGLLGILLAHWLRDLVWALRPRGFATEFTIPIDLWVLLFAIAATAATGLLFGLVPAISAARVDLLAVLKRDLPGGGVPLLSFRNVLVAGQVALSVLALVIAGLFVRSLQQSNVVDLGWNSRGIALLYVNGGAPGATPVRTLEYYQRAVERLRSVPGVVDVSHATRAFLTGVNPQRTIRPQGDDEALRTRGLFVSYSSVMSNYLHFMGIGLVNGRDFTDADDNTRAPVAIVNESFARRFFPGQDPVGRMLKIYQNETEIQIVGVSRDVRDVELRASPAPYVFFPLKQQFSPNNLLHVRVSGDPAALLPTLRKELQALDPTMTIGGENSYEAIIRHAMWGPRTGAALMSAFGLIALFLTSLGIYALMAHAVGQRTREIGIRLAIGAQGRSVVGMIMQRGVLVTVAGIVAGLLASLALTRYLGSFLFEVTPTDPLTFTAIAVLLAVIALLACYLPARRATKVDPLIALRTE